MLSATMQALTNTVLLKTLTCHAVERRGVRKKAFQTQNIFFVDRKGSALTADYGIDNYAADGNHKYDCAKNHNYDSGCNHIYDDVGNHNKILSSY